jgi:hypothetical protein
MWAFAKTRDLGCERDKLRIDWARNTINEGEKGEFPTEFSSLTRISNSRFPELSSRIDFQSPGTVTYISKSRGHQSWNQDTFLENTVMTQLN